jgi:hypothetical protein
MVNGIVTTSVPRIKQYTDSRLVMSVLMNYGKLHVEHTMSSPQQ